jgi:hypothetical protein
MSRAFWKPALKFRFLCSVNVYEFTITILKTLHLFADFTALYQILIFHRMVGREVVLAFLKILMFEAEKITKGLVRMV